MKTAMQSSDSESALSFSQGESKLSPARSAPVLCFEAVSKSYLRNAGRTLLRYGFEELGLHRIWCEIYGFDQAKQRLLPRLGFTLDGRHRETHWAEGAWHDSLFYGILDREFEARSREREHAA